MIFIFFLKIHKFFIYNSWKLKIIFKTFATNCTFIIFKSQTLCWDRKNWFFFFLFIYFPLLELENSLFSSSRARKQIFRPPNYEFPLFCMEWKLNNYKGIASFLWVEIDLSVYWPVSWRLKWILARFSTCSALFLTRCQSSWPNFSRVSLRTSEIIWPWRLRTS